jgi:acyl-CoA thioester hydrolase
VTYRLGVFAQGAEPPAAEGHFIHVYVGRADRRPVSLPPKWKSALDGLL